VKIKTTFRLSVHSPLIPPFIIGGKKIKEKLERFQTALTNLEIDPKVELTVGKIDVAYSNEKVKSHFLVAALDLTCYFEENSLKDATETALIMRRNLITVLERRLKVIFNKACVIFFIGDDIVGKIVE